MIAWKNAPWRCINPLPKDKCIDWSILKAFADAKKKKNEICLRKGRKHCGKRTAFSPFPTMFSKCFNFKGLLKLRILW